MRIFRACTIYIFPIHSATSFKQHILVTLLKQLVAHRYDRTQSTYRQVVEKDPHNSSNSWKICGGYPPQGHDDHRQKLSHELLPAPFEPATMKQVFGIRFVGRASKANPDLVSDMLKLTKMLAPRGHPHQRKLHAEEAWRSTPCYIPVGVMVRNLISLASSVEKSTSSQLIPASRASGKNLP
jgi:hypothetical protein